MTKLSKSPDRNTFQRDCYVKRQQEKNQEVDQTVLQMWEQVDQRLVEQEQDLEWKKNNLEHDLRSTDWILNKARSSKTYAQNIYAALCNTDWQKLEVIPILKDQVWSCSWRHAGGVVADMRQEGDYIDWYCSGIRGGLDYNDNERVEGYVEEGYVTDEIREDFQKLGWVLSKSY